ESGNPTGQTARTDANGNYSFAGLAAGVYSVVFTDPDGVLEGKVLVDANVGDDATDSDAIGNVLQSAIEGITVNAGQNTPDNDAGVEVANAAPEVTDDAAIDCADDPIVVDLSDNFSDPDGDNAAITMIGDQNIADGQTVTLDGTATFNGADFDFSGLQVTRDGDSFIFDGEAAFADLDIGEQAVANISFKVEDSEGAATEANIEVTFKGDANSVEGLALNLPDSATVQLVDNNDPAGSSDEGFTLRITNGSSEINGTYAEAYCIAIFDPFIADGFGADVALAPSFDNADVFLGIAGEVPTGVLETVGINGASASDNLDEITWILNQDFNNQGFTDAEIQGAIWALTDGQRIEDEFNFEGGIFIAEGGGDVSDAQAIIDMALTEGSGFVAGEGDLVGVVIDSNDPAFDQPFIVGIAYDDIDCLC
ncbi:hypothetical protein N9L47_13815, partial [Rhodobacteraceae bacterium]|nr:hypothetical protein [Paracoccaceae bacterium]